MFTLWIFIIEIDTLVFPLVARTPGIIALALECVLIFRSDFQSSLWEKNIIKPQDVWFDVLLNPPPLATFCCACQ